MTIVSGDAQIMAWEDGNEFLGEALRDYVTSGEFLKRVPSTDSPIKWPVFCVFGVLPCIRLAEWCGCVDVDVPTDNMLMRLFHRYNAERERRVIMIWDHLEPAGGQVVLVDGFETMRHFFRSYENAPEQMNVKGYVS